MSGLELRQLRYFVAVAETGQLTDAARRLEISQPTLSQALAQLEAQLGVQLLERHTRGARLTEAGRLFLDKARAAVGAADEAAETAEVLGRSQAELVAVGFHWLPLTRWAPMFRRLCQQSPGTRLRWQPLDFPLEGRSPIEAVDVGLVLEPTPHPELATLALHRQARAVMVAATHPLANRDELTVAEVLDETWPGCHPSMDRRWQAFWSLDEERGGPARTTEERITKAEEGTEVVASGRAIVTIPVGMAAGYPHPGLVAIPLVDARPATLELMWRADNGNPLVEALVEIARETIDGAEAEPAAPSPDWQLKSL